MDYKRVFERVCIYIGRYILIIKKKGSIMYKYMDIYLKSK